MLLVSKPHSRTAEPLRAFLESYGTPYRLPPIAGRCAGRGLVIVGDAACVWDDLERFGCRNDHGRGSVAKLGWDFLTVNKAVENFPGNVLHAYSNEPAVLRRFMAARRQEYTREFGFPETHSISDGVDWVWPFGGHGTSGLGAGLVGIGLGYDRIVYCGVPLDDGPHNGEPPWRKTAFATAEAAGGQRKDRNPHWDTAIELAFDGRVRSMSGRTKTWLGDGMEWRG